jgi:acetyl esterase/lipase
VHPDTVVERVPRPGLARWKRWLSLRAYGLITSTLFGARTSPHRMRRRFERFGAVTRAALQRKYPKLAFADHAVGPLSIEGIAAVETPRCAVVYLHGGGFVMGSPASYRNRAMRLSYRCGAEVFVPDYRLAPEHPFPAALDDALAAWQYVKALRPERPILVAGDSAGGGLALSLILRLRQLGHARPDGAILLSPWTDLSASGASMDENHRKDLWLSRDHIHNWARHYTCGCDERDPLVSPVFADLSELPPLLVLAGEHEVLLDDARRVVEGARRAGTDAELLVGTGMQHDWPLTLPWLDESRHAWRAMVRFVDDAAGSRRSIGAGGKG